MKKIKIFSVLMISLVLCGFNILFAAEITKGGNDNIPKVATAGTPKVATAKLPDDIGDDKISGVTDLADRIWSSAILIVQVVSVGCVVFAGLRYMYASADKKADIKKGMMYLAIGAIFVFATSTVMRFIFSIGNSIITSP